MDTQYLPSYFRLSSRAIAELIADVEHRRDGADIFYVFDPHDLIEFCFPIDPKTQKQPDIASIADDQAAMFEVFMRRRLSPLLIREYEGELSVFSSYLSNDADDAYDKTEILAYFLRHLNIQGASVESDETLVKLLQQDFSVILAVLMGIYSFGVKRFREVAGARMWRETNLASAPYGAVDAEIVEAFNSTKVTPFYYELRDFLFSLIPDLRLKSDVIKRQQAAENDAHVVDRLLQVNSLLEKAYRAGKLKKRKLFLYLSSADKTEQMFVRGPATANTMPTIGDAPYNIWRSRSQVFASLIFRSRPGKDRVEDTPEDFDVLANNLKKFQELVRPMEGLYPLSSRRSLTQCKTCVLREAEPWPFQPSYKPTCPWTDLCQHVSRLSFDKQATELQNLGLLSNIQRYARLRDASFNTKDAANLLALFRRLLDSSEIQDIALQRLQDVQEEIATRGEFAQLMSEGIEMGLEEMGSAAAKEELVSSPIQTLPIAIQLKEPRYLNIVTNFVKRYTGSRSVSARTELLIENYRMFLGHEKQSVLSSPEHELVRCLLYLAFDTNAGRQLAAKHVGVIMDKFQAQPGYLLECHYILLWACRKNRWFAEGERLAKEILVNHPEDARIWHGRCLNGYEWRTSDVDNCPLTIADLWRFSEEALKAHNLSDGNLKISDDLRRLIHLVLLNDLAYIYVLDDRENDVTKGREYLAKLKELCPANDWGENPEFLHTEAMVVYREAGQAHTAEATSKLKIALRNLETAIDVFPKREFLDLAEKIQVALGQVRTKSRKSN